MKGVGMIWLVLALMIPAVSWGGALCVPVADGETISVSGRVVDDDDGTAISHVLCSVRRGKGAPLSYTFTDDDGQFSLNGMPTDSISFSLIGYAKQMFPVSQIGINHTVRLKKSDLALKEIVVKAPPIRERGDTLVFDVNSFKTQDDKYISDVLKKLPGVTVSDNGAIEYQGRGINKFYIEGRDLLEGKYTLASNGLDVNAVRSVEIIEHNQHVKSLKDVRPSDRAAINLKLDKGFIARPFGDGKVAAGNGPVYDASLLTTFLSRGPQLLVTLKANNSGRSYADEADDKYSFAEGMTYISRYMPIYSAPGIRRLQLPLNRYLFNRSKLASVNILIPVAKDAELKLNALFASDRLRQRFNSDQWLMTGRDESLHLFERGGTRSSADNLNLSGKYELNSTTTFVSDEFGYESMRNRGVSSMYTQSDSVDSDVDVLPREFYNKLNLHQRFGRSQLVSFRSNLRVGLSPEMMEAMFPMEPTAAISEHMRMRRLITKNEIESSFSLSGQRLGVSVFANYEELRPRYGAPTTVSDKISQLELGARPLMEFRMHGDKIYLRLVPSVSLFRAVAAGQDVRKASVKFVPSVSFSYRLTTRWEARIGGSRDFRFMNDEALFPAPFMSDYRTEYLPSGNLHHAESLSSYCSLTYRNTVKLMFGRLNASYSWRKSNYVTTSTYTSDRSVIATELRDNSGYSFDISAELSKTFAGSKTTIKIQPSFMRSGQDVIQQSLLCRNTYTMLLGNVTVSNRWWTHFNIQYKLIGSYMHTHSRDFGGNTLTNWFHTVDMSYFPSRKFSVDLKCELSTLDNASSGHKNFFFCDLGSAYSLRKVTFELTARNIFNMKEYTIRNISSVNRYESSIPLRGCEVMGSVKFKF